MERHPRHPPMNEPAGLLPVDKPEGPTSHDVVGLARRALGTRRIGHTGTLDPFASGLLLLCVGRATRLARYLGALDKTYVARMRLGVATDTDDATGAVTSVSDDWTRVTAAGVEAALARQVGEIEQTPPAFSAKRIQGERAYRLARSGRPAAIAAVPVRIDAIRLIRFEPPEADFEITCGTGTYIRAVARDAGRALGVGAHLTRLRRTRIGRFDVADAVPALRLDDPAAVRAAWIEPLAAVRHLSRIDLAADQIPVVVRGGAIPSPPLPDRSGPVALAAHGRLVAIGEVQGDRVQPRTVIA